MKLIAVPSLNFEERKDKIQFIIIHATATKDLEETFTYLIDSQKPQRLSSHYVIDRDGTVYVLVAEEKRAFHCGISDWKGYCEKTGMTGLNDASIGIELQCPCIGEDTLGDFTQPQLASCFELCQRIMKRHNIVPQNVLRHSDIAPGRKKDPGELFPWTSFKKSLEDKYFYTKNDS